MWTVLRRCTLASTGEPLHLGQLVFRIRLGQVLYEPFAYSFRFGLARSFKVVKRVLGSTGRVVKRALILFAHIPAEMLNLDVWVGSIMLLLSKIAV